MAKTYSGGMRRRLDLAASLVGRPAVIFLDEPTTGLDPAKREDMWDVVRNLVDDGSTVLLTTQYLDEADALADEITVIDHGRVIAHDTPDGLKRVIGGQRIGVTPSDRGRLDDVAAAAGRRHRPRRRRHRPRRAHRARRPTTTCSRDVVGRLAAEGIGVNELSLHLPSLDEVFLTLTGHGTTDAPIHGRGSGMTTTTAPLDDPHTGPVAVRRPRPARRADHRRRLAVHPRPRARPAQPHQDVAHARGAHRRDPPAGDLPGAVHLHLRRRDRRRLAAGVPAVPAAGHARPDSSPWPASASASTSTRTSRRASSTGSGRCRSRGPPRWSAPSWPTSSATSSSSS